MCIRDRLWCRAWQQTPVASLPDDDRILAAFAGVSVQKWRRIKDMAMRGFVLCNDGRYYHRVLADEALRAWEKHTYYRARRARDNARLKRFREARQNPQPEESETPDETPMKRVSQHTRNAPGNAAETEEETRCVQGTEAEVEVEGEAEGERPPPTPPGGELSLIHI